MTGFHVPSGVNDEGVTNCAGHAMEVAERISCVLSQRASPLNGHSTMISASSCSWRPLVRSALPLLSQFVGHQAPSTTSRAVAAASAMSSSSMKAVTYEKPGGLEVLQYVDVERPAPGQVGACTSCAQLAQLHVMLCHPCYKQSRDLSGCC